MTTTTEGIVITEVALRDGLQDYPGWVPTAGKAEILAALGEAGVDDIEVTSFVRADRIPQLADADALSAIAEVRRHPGYSALVPNRRGLQRALQAGYRRMTVVISASDAHNQANLGADLETWTFRTEELIAEATSFGVTVRAAISVAFGCPFEGEVPTGRVIALARRLSAAGAAEVSLADTIGRGEARDVKDLVGAVADTVGATPSLHLHTLGAPGHVVEAALAAGVRHFDSSLTGIGGCPYAPGAPGNLATEDLLAILNGRAAPLEPELLTAAADLLRRALADAHPMVSRR